MYNGYLFNHGFMVSHPQTFEVIQWGLAIGVPSADSYALRQAYKRACAWMRESRQDTPYYGESVRPLYHLTIYRICDGEMTPAYIVDWQGKVYAWEVE
jgi:hypothetical protein